MMKKSFFSLLAFTALFFSGCTKPYVDVKTNNYATVQLVPKSKTLLFTDDYYALIHDYRKMISKPNCGGKSSLGIVKTNSDEPSRIIKIAAEKEHVFNVNYVVSNGNNTYTEYTQFILKPQKHRQYVIVYEKKDINLFKSVSDFSTYEKRGGRLVSIPSSRIRSFSNLKECAN